MNCVIVLMILCGGLHFNVCGKKIQHNNEMVEDVHLYVKNLRGSLAYWSSAMSELIAQIRCLGPPHYFITLSCNDLHWEDMIIAMLIADGDTTKDPKTVGAFEAQKLVEKFPVVVSRHFMTHLLIYSSTKQPINVLILAFTAHVGGQSQRAEVVP